MTTLKLKTKPVAKKATLSKTKQKEQRIKAFLANYSIPFDMEDAAIDLRTMAKNYPTGIIPSKDITDAVNAVLGAPPMPRLSVDPRTLNIPKFTWAPMDDVGINPIFQRDISPNHLGNNIEPKFRSDMIIVPCAIKDPVTGKFLLWDGNHTRQVCERQGWTHLPVWYTEATIDDDHSLQQAAAALILKAGQSFLVINKTGKRDVGRYDEHMISVECGVNKSIIIQNIVNANNCQVKRQGNNPGDITHIAHLYDAYELTQASTSIQGIYLARALKFHRATWPKEEVVGIMLYALARMYEQTDRQLGSMPPADFDVEFGAILKKKYGFSNAVHGDETTGIKGAYAAHFGALANHPVAVTSGLILTYMKHGKNGFKLAQPEVTFPVK